MRNHDFFLDKYTFTIKMFNHLYRLMKTLHTGDISNKQKKIQANIDL